MLLFCEISFYVNIFRASGANSTVLSSRIARLLAANVSRSFKYMASAEQLSSLGIEYIQRKMLLAIYIYIVY